MRREKASLPLTSYHTKSFITVIGAFRRPHSDNRSIPGKETLPDRELQSFPCNYSLSTQQGFLRDSFPGIGVYGGKIASVRINCSLDFAYCYMHGSSACLGCAIKSKLIPSVNGSLKRQNPQAQKASKASIPNTSERFWTSGIAEMDNSTIVSQGSMSSVSTSTQMHDTQCTSSSIAPSEFVNHGLIRWKQTRQQWIGNRKPKKRSQQLREPRLSWNASYDSLLGRNKPFPKPVPLAEMIDFLVDIWEQEGMYD